jgi:hypothetical protein
MLECGVRRGMYISADFSFARWTKDLGLYHSMRDGLASDDGGDVYAFNAMCSSSYNRIVVSSILPPIELKLFGIQN